MRVGYTNRAASNLRKAIVNSRQEFGDRVASELAAYVRQTVDRLALHPESAPVVTERPGLRAQSLRGRYPYVIFYRVFEAEFASCTSAIHHAGPLIRHRTVLDEASKLVRA